MTYSAFKAACKAIETLYGLEEGNGWRYIHSMTIADNPTIDFQPLLKNSLIRFTGTGGENEFTGFIIKVPKIDDQLTDTVSSDNYQRLRVQFIPVETIIALTFVNDSLVTSICDIVHKQFGERITPAIKFTHDSFEFYDYRDLYSNLGSHIYTSLPCEVKVMFFKTEQEREEATKDSTGIKVQLPGTYYVKAYVFGSDNFTSFANCTVVVKH